ncbi:MAG: virulence RhuM family protein [Dehalococcoidia bacterium]|nr:virulence RhuM family protein [Dehalococcoidia bacterium]
MEDDKPKSELILYQTEDGKTRIEVRLEGKTVWLSLSEMTELFQRDKSVISKHIKNIFEEGELKPEATVANYATVQQEGSRSVSRMIEYFNLDVIISVGYRVRSPRGTQFRIWATERLREFIIKGFTLNDDLLKQAGGGNYFEELLARIRDIRSSEKIFWRKVLDIYATSIDYDPNVDVSQQFFATVQNKMHWAAHGHTAAEIVAERADATLPTMGLTSWTGSRPRKSDVGVAKNYLKAEELDALNRIVTAYLEFAELQARNRRPMYMRDWITKLDDFLRLSDQEILTHAGKVSHEVALKKAEEQYEEFHAKQLAEPTEVEKHFLDAVKKIEQLNPGETKRKKRRKSE